MKKVLLGVAAAALLVPAGANADWNYTICAPGAAAPAYTACASANVSFTGGQILLKVKNTGLFYNNAAYNTWGYAITGIGIEGPAVAAPKGLAGVTTSGAGVENVGNAQDGWAFSTNLDGFSVEAGAETTSGANAGIWGCSGTPGGSSYFRTCGEGEWVQFAFNTSSTNWAPAPGARVWLAMRGQSGYNGDSYRCSDDPTASNGADCYFGEGGVDTTTPEPISLVLLGSGLLGLAGIRNRRRRS